MRTPGLWLGVALCALLVACGEGGSGGGGSIAVVPAGSAPTPTTPASPTPTPTPTPPPSTGALNTGELKPTSDATFIAATMEMSTTGSSANDLTGQTTGGTTSDRSTVFDTPGFTAGYGAATGYRLADSINSTTFGPSQLASDTTSSDKFYPTVLFTSVSAQTENYLALYKEQVSTSAGQCAATLLPKYAGIGGWQNTKVASVRRTRIDYFAFGPATPEIAMPHSGVVKFFLTGSGNYATDSDLYFTTNLNTVTIDFGTGMISGGITANGHSLYNNGFGGLFGVTLAGSIAGNSATGPTSSSVAVASGQFRLMFVGPHADELIVTYVGQDGRGSYVGSAIGVRDPC